MKRSDLIIPISIVAHLIIINWVIWYFMPVGQINIFTHAAISAFWIAVTVSMDFYPTTRKERFFTNLHKFIQVYFLFCLSYFTVLAFIRYEFVIMEQAYLLNTVFLALLGYRILFYFVRNKYRMLGGNSATVVVIGEDQNLNKIKQMFNQPEFGYRYIGYFSDSPSSRKSYRGDVSSSFKYILENNIDEIYCLASQVNKKELHNIITFADNNLKRLKIIPDNKEIFTRAMDVEMFDQLPVINLRKSPLESSYAFYGKRLFDIVFSSLVIVAVLSWLVPILYVLVKMESPGPLFFKQKRHGINKKVFGCYKFRSMTVNTDANSKMATKNDARVTKIGQFMRKTSIDELPQFFNVFLGQMSVVGPRPHMEAHTFEYEKSVDKYLVRHYAKPGVTGLAQVKGYRGEILEHRDIINRTRMDIFYLEKWSPVLDAKIIYSTVANAVGGEEKAY